MDSDDDDIPAARSSRAADAVPSGALREVFGGTVDDHAPYLIPPPPSPPTPQDNDSSSDSDSSSGVDGASDGSGAASDGDGGGSGAGEKTEKVVAESDSDSESGFVRKRKPARGARRRAAAKDGGDGGGARKRKRPSAGGVKRYVEDAAAEGGDDEEDDDAAAAFKELKARGMTRDDYQKEVIARIKRENEAKRERERRQKSAEEVAAELETRYKGGAYRTDMDDDDGGAAGSGANEAALPSITDPKLWQVRCKEGSEVGILIALMNKFVAKKEEGDPLAIMSASSTAPGIIYIECFREAHARIAASGIPDLWGFKPGSIQLVPVPQMTSALRVSALRDVFSVGDLVRVTRGAYKGDVAQIVRGAADASSKVLIRLVPRMNLKALAMPRRGGGARGPPRVPGAGARPPQRLYDRTELEDALTASAGPDAAAAVENRLKWGLRLDVYSSHAFSPSSRLLYKEVTSNFLTPNGPKPNQDEIAFFQSEGASSEVTMGGGASAPRAVASNLDDGANVDSDGDADADIEKARKRAQRLEEERLLKALELARAAMGTDVNTTLTPGDAVVVVRGDLQGLSGRVTAVNVGGTFTLEPSAESAAALGLSSALEVPSDEAVKTFDVGMHVKVIAGVYMGETGTVLQTRPANEGGEDVTAFILTLLLDSGQRTVDVFVRDAVVSVDVVTSVASIDGYTLHDLVELSTGGDTAAQAGVVVELMGQRELRVLLPTGRDTVILSNAIRGRVQAGRGAGAIANDINGTPLASEDVVRVVQGESEGGVGTIKHIFKGHLFLHNFSRPNNSGIFVARAGRVMLASTRSRAVDVAPQVQSRRGGSGKQDDLRGKTVMIKKGEFKSRIGTVREISGDNLSIELHQGQAKRANVPKADAEVVGDHTGRFNSAGSAPRFPQASAGVFLGGGGATPHISHDTGFGQTPAYGGLGGATPAYGGMGGATPAYGGAGGATPAYGGGGGATPAYGGIGGATPMYGAVGGATPAYPAIGGATPMYGGGRTPMYGAAGGRTPMAGAGGRTPMIGAPGGATPGGGGTFGMGFAPAEGRDIQLAAAVKGDISADCDLAGAWACPGVRIEAVSGPHRGRKGVIKSVGASGAAAQVRLDDMAANVNVNLADTIPEKPSGIQDSFVRILGGEFVGKVGKVIIREDEFTLLVTVGDDEAPESLPTNILVAMVKL